MADTVTTTQMLRSLRPHRARLRRELERQAGHRGMTAGLPRIQVDSYVVGYLLDALDECEASLSLAIEAMRWAQDHASGCDDWCERPPRGIGCRYCHISAALEVIDDG